MINQNLQQNASLQILYSEEPQVIGDLFVEIRQWQTANLDQQELIVEYGRLQEDGELLTEIQVVPLYQTIREVLENLKQ